MKLLSIILLCLSGCITTDYVTQRELNDHINRETYCRLRVEDYNRAMFCCYESNLCQHRADEFNEQEYKQFWCGFVKDYERECI